MMIRSIVRRAFVAPITFYQHLVSPLKPSSCIYYPTCSHYAKEAVLSHGIVVGTLLGLLRILRCFGVLYTGGADPVPSKVSLRYLFGSYYDFFRYRRRRSESV